MLADEETVRIELTHGELCELQVALAVAPDGITGASLDAKIAQAWEQCFQEQVPGGI
jgi:hypothetical protein